MMRRKATMLAMVMAAILGLMATPGARAEDEAGGDSPAEQAYRDAWWAETSSGALDRALDGYRKAIEAEGPAAVRALALYRSAVVLERIGKTDDAIRALERLAKDFPDASDLQAKARDRLEAWTAVDLRTNFGEWYERYKYSPEFQGRVVELVLKLGTPGDVANAAANELLIIGDAAVPALTAHLDSSNAELRGRAVDLLLQLGGFPPALHLAQTSHWKRGTSGWRRVLLASEDVRTRMLAELEDLGDDGDLALLRALLKGRSGWARAVAITPDPYLLRAMLGADPGEAVLVELRNLVTSPGTVPADMLSNLLLWGDVVPDHVALGWLQIPGAREQVARRIQDGSLRSPAAVQSLVDAMNALPVDAREQPTLFRAFLRSLSDAPASLDLRSAALAYERVAPSGNVRLSGHAALGSGALPEDVSAVSRFLVQVVDEARDPRLAEDALNTWARIHRGDADASRQLIAWARVEATPQVSLRAAKYAGEYATDETLDALLEALGAQSPAIDAYLVDGLKSNRRLSGLPWTDARILKLHAFARSVDDALRTQVLGRLFEELHTLPDRVDQLIRLALESPTRVWSGVTSHLDESTAVLLAQPGFREAWSRWSLEERLAGLDLFNGLAPTAYQDAALAAFLRGQLAEQMAVRGDTEREALEREVKLRLLGVLPTVTLDDVRVVFDLADPDAAAAAAGLERLEKTAEVYDALAAARRAEEQATRWVYWGAWAHAQGDLRRKVARDLARDPWPGYRANALRDLGLFRDAADIGILLEALADPEPDVRAVAAETLAKMYDQTAIEALVKALDDPSPEVRDQVLETLEAIKEVEEKKDYWREFAEGKR